MNINNFANFNWLRRAFMHLKKVLIRRLGLVSDQFFFLDSHMLSRTGPAVEKLAVYSNTEKFSYTTPFNGNEIINCYPERYIYGLDESVVDPLSGFIYDSAGIFIAESSAWNILRNFYSWPKPFIRKPKKILLGQYIFLHDIGYYHWLIEELPVFLSSYKKYPDSIILVNNDPSPWQKCFLDSLEGAKIQYITYPVCLERLIMTGKTAGQGNPLFGVTPNPSDIAVLRDYFKNYIHNIPSSRLKLFLSRSGESRCPKNIAEVERFMESKGYQVVNTNLNLSIFEQMELFSSAKKIIGIHGAAMSNIAWCPSDVEIIELATQGYLPPCFTMIASIRSLNYSWHSYGSLPEDAIEIEMLDPFI